MTILFIASSSASKVSPDGSTITINLVNPINVYQKYLRVLNCSFWNNFQNVNDIYNNRVVTFTYNSIVRTLTFAEGVYSVDDLNETIAGFMINNGMPTGLLFIQPDESTSRLALIVTTSVQFSINFDVNNSLFHNTLGFSGSYTTSVNKVIPSTSKPTLYIYENVVLHVSFCGGSTIHNERAGSDIACIMPLNSRTGELVFYEPIHPCKVPCFGSEVGTFSVYITDQNGTKLNTNTESYSVTMELIDSVN